MMKHKIHKAVEKSIVGVLFVFLFFLTILSAIYADPSRPTINFITNETSTSSGTGALRSGDDGGYIITLELNTNQQDNRWKAYVGNITGKFVLEDSDAFSIYEWDMNTNILGEVYISRNQTVQWATVNCSNRTTIENEDTFLTLSSQEIDSINKTFSTSIHKNLTVAGRTILNSTCPAISTFVGANETLQTSGENNIFQEILLQDNIGNLVYTSIIQNDYLGFDNNSYDFQAIIADDDTNGVQTNYYFYVELGV